MSRYSHIHHMIQIVILLSGVKINVDACVKVGKLQNTVHLSVVVRNEDMELIDWSHIEYNVNAQEKAGSGDIEIGAIAYGIHFLPSLKSLGFDISGCAIRIETDSKRAKAAVDGKDTCSNRHLHQVGWRTHDELLKDFCSETGFSCQTFHIKLNENRIADFIGRAYKDKEVVDETAHMSYKKLKDYVRAW